MVSGACARSLFPGLGLGLRHRTARFQFFGGGKGVDSLIDVVDKHRYGRGHPQTQLLHVKDFPRFQVLAVELQVGLIQQANVNLTDRLA